MIVQFTDNKAGILISNMETSSYRLTDIYIDYYPNYMLYTADSQPGDKTYTISVVSAGAYYSTTVPAEDLCAKFSINSLDDGVFYIWLVYKDTAAEPGEDKIYMSCLIDYGSLYDISMKLIANYYNSEGCVVPKTLEEFCIFYDAVKLCVVGENWPLLNNIWGKVIGKQTFGDPCACGK